MKRTRFLCSLATGSRARRHSNINHAKCCTSAFLSPLHDTPRAYAFLTSARPRFASAMDPSRPPDHPSAFRRRTASLSELHAPHDHHDQPSLPPIRSLHPFLNPPPPQPSSSHPPHGSAGEGSSAYGFSDAPHSSSMHAHGMPAPASLSHQREHDYTMADSDAEDDQQGPPKKKRRRQALSCTGE